MNVEVKRILIFFLTFDELNGKHIYDQTVMCNINFLIKEYVSY